MKYISTRGGTAPINFSDAVMTGLARDGGLMLPEEFPCIKDKLSAWADLPYTELAYEIMKLYADDLTEQELRSVIEKSYATFRHPEITPTQKVGPVYVLELFHGPTFAFKDVALQFLGNMFELILNKTGAKLNIIAATSGDTGSAAIHGVRGRKGINIFVMHPNGRVSAVQELQMTSVMDANVYNIAVDGTFDDAQAIVKTLFGDLNFKDKYSLGAVNSINWARVLAQVVYYFYAGLKVMKETSSDKISFSVPTGNFGDIFAGYVAYLMGLPIDKLILATNENDILSRFFNTGVYNVEGVHPTISPSMDIQVASNFERWLYLHANRNSEQLCAWMQQFKETKSLTIGNPDELDEIMIAGKADTAKTLATIKRFYEDSKYVLDPHTAVGVSVALDKAPTTPVICLATAHPAKFPDAIKDATGESNLATAPEIEALKGKPTRKFNLPADAGAVAAFVIEKLQ